MNEVVPPAPAAPVVAPTVAATEELVSIEDFLRLKFRVARIESVEAVPKSSKLLKLQVDVGSLGKRQILAGIAKHYSPESLIGKKIVIIANLKPAMMMGLESQGMMLAASSEDGLLLNPLNPGDAMPEGAVVR